MAQANLFTLGSYGGEIEVATAHDNPTQAFSVIVALAFISNVTRSNLL